MTRNIELLVAYLEHHIPFYANQQTHVSQSNIGWHIEHALLTIDRIIDRLSQTNRNDFQWKISIPRLLVFTLNKIPRGRAKAPKAVQPEEDINPEALAQHLQLTKEKLKALRQLHPGQYFEHPYFGHLKVKPAIKFLEIHTKHHLKIIRDIKGY